MRQPPAQRLGIGCVRLAIVGFATAALASAFGILPFNISPAAACGFHNPCPPGSPPTPLSSVLYVESLGYFAQRTSQVGLTGVQEQISGIEDRLQCEAGGNDPNPERRIACQRRRSTTSQPLGFAEQAPTEDSAIDSTFGILAYSGHSGPMLVKAPPPSAAPSPSPISFSAWTQGSVDDEVRTGTFAGAPIGSRTLTWVGLAGADVTIPHLVSSTDAAVFGLLAGDTTASVHGAGGSTTDIEGPSIGTYGAYVNGPFSIDGTFKTDFLTVDTDSAGVNLPFGLNNYTGAGNVKYKQDFGSWWLQPTAGVTYTFTAWNTTAKAFGMTDGTDTRVQAGARIGSGFDWAGIHFTETLTLLAYDDVSISGGTLAVATGTPLAPTDQGKVFAEVGGKLEAELTKNWSASIEGEYRGRTDVYGLAGRVGLTYSFN